MTLKERCQAGEAKLDQVSAALLDPRPDILDRCEADLQEVIASLETVTETETANSPAQVAKDDDPSTKSDLVSLRSRIRLLALQAQHATNLCQGWTQMGVAEGYTDQGRPVLPPSQPQASYEV